MNRLHINDAIHHVIELAGDELGVLNHPYVQRLRHIRQLGFVSLVYPSATHDRLSHSLGAMHVVSKLGRQLFYNEEYSLLARLLADGEKEFLMRIIRLAALLHDIGHAPFSHTAEKLMPPLHTLALPAEWIRSPLGRRAATHEDYTVLLLNGMASEKNAVISKDDAHIASSLIHHNLVGIPLSWARHFSSSINASSVHDVARSLVSSDLDGDRMDYLLRDAHFAGVTYGHFDLSWLVGNLGIVPMDGSYAMSISESGIQSLEHYLLARYNMYAQVYLHKTVKCFEYYFQRALDENELDYAIPADRDCYTALRDSTLTESLFRAARENSWSWSGRLMRREAAHRVARIWDNEANARKIMVGLARDLKGLGVEPFLSFTSRKFLETNEQRTGTTQKRNNPSLFSGLATVPIRVVRTQFGVVSHAPLADYSFILKRYHEDIAVGDIYIPREQFEAHDKKIARVMKKYHTLSASETILTKEER